MFAFKLYKDDCKLLNWQNMRLQFDMSNDEVEEMNILNNGYWKLSIKYINESNDIISKSEILITISLSDIGLAIVSLEFRVRVWAFL